ncbi:MAG: hypothetical protein HUJ85_07410 [Veillonella sp.]|nr:hypothetical protein [Veillonella sp.]
MAKLAKMGYTSTEAACYDNGKLYGVTPEQYKKDIETAGLAVLSSHVGHNLSDKELASGQFDGALKWWKQCIDCHKKAGMKYMVMPGVNFPKTLAEDKVFKITLDDEVNTKVNKVGDTIHFTVAENIMDGDVLLVPAGTAGTGTITTLKKAGVFGRNAKLDIKFDNIPAIDGTEFVAVQGEEAQEEAKKSQLKAGGASVAGAVLLGPVGLLGGAFIKGNNIDLPAGSTIYVQPESPVTIQGVVIGGDGLNHANDLVDATEVTEEPVEDVDAVSGEAVDTTSVDEATTESVDENGQDVEETTDEVVDEETEEPASEEDTADTNDKEALKTSSVVEESKPALNVSKPIVVVKRS